MILEADPRPRLTQWPCRVPADVSDALEFIQKVEHDDKSGVIRHLLLLGIRAWQKEERARQSLSGVSLDQILPYLGGKGGAWKVSEIEKEVRGEIGQNVQSI
jgi:hypothetical protein